MFLLLGIVFAVGLARANDGGGWGVDLKKWKITWRFVSERGLKESRWTLRIKLSFIRLTHRREKKQC
jgi:hypothetical protein